MLARSAASRFLRALAPLAPPPILSNSNCCRTMSNRSINAANFQKKVDNDKRIYHFPNPEEHMRIPSDSSPAMPKQPEAEPEAEVVDEKAPATATSASSVIDYGAVPTPPACYADFCLIPVGTGSVSVAEDVAEVQRLLQASGLTVTMHSAGTTVEGPWDDVFRVIGQAHTIVHQRGVLRVQSSMRVGTRTDKKQTAADKVKRVADILGKEPNAAGTVQG